jgi:hypothetical protein
MVSLSLLPHAARRGPWIVREHYWGYPVCALFSNGETRIAGGVVVRTLDLVNPQWSIMFKRARSSQ